MKGLNLNSWDLCCDCFMGEFGILRPLLLSNVFIVGNYVVKKVILKTLWNKGNKCLD